MFTFITKVGNSGKMLPYLGEDTRQNFPAEIWFIVFHSRSQNDVSRNITKKKKKPLFIPFCESDSPKSVNSVIIELFSRLNTVSEQIQSKTMNIFAAHIGHC